MVRSSMFHRRSGEPARRKRDVVGFRRAHAAGNLHPTATDFGPDDRAMATSPLPFSISRMALKNAAVSRVMSLKMRRPPNRRWVDGRFLRLVVEAGLGIGQSVTGQRDLFLTSSGWPPRSTKSSTPNGT